MLLYTPRNSWVIWVNYSNFLTVHKFWQILSIIKIDQISSSQIWSDYPNCLNFFTAVQNFLTVEKFGRIWSNYQNCINFLWAILVKLPKLQKFPSRNSPNCPILLAVQDLDNLVKLLEFFSLPEIWADLVKLPKLSKFPSRQGQFE